ncbi:MAG: hypothetical protein NDI84_17400 [Steroidobacteraceae bacterium]|nr:hypothetical protein [Steroidobacteraceae bacterium]
MGPYHAIMVHFPVALWIVASAIVIFRALSASPLALAFDRVLMPFLVLGVVTGLIAYTLGQLVWPPDTLQSTPLGRNHMMTATWSLTCWSVVLFLRWRGGERVWDGRANRLVMLILGALGGLLLAATGTLGGHLHGAPAYLSEIVRMLIGWDVYETHYIPNWALGVLAVVIVAMPALAIATSRAHARRQQREGGAT